MYKLENFFKPINDKVYAEVIPSKRFKDNDGNYAIWKIQSISEDENDAIIKASTHKGERDLEEYEENLILATVVEPKLNDERLCKAYNCNDPSKVVKKMLLAGEYRKLVDAIFKTCGFNNAEDIFVEAKN